MRGEGQWWDVEIVYTSCILPREPLKKSNRILLLLLLVGVLFVCRRFLSCFVVIIIVSVF